MKNVPVTPRPLKQAKIARFFKIICLLL